MKIGDVFTPVSWGEFAIEQFDMFNRWIAGAKVFDPCMGQGNLLESLISYGLKQGYALDQLPVSSLFGNELNREYHQQALNKFFDQYGLDMGINFWNEDILRLSPRKFDILFGNPPWMNFVALPEDYKSKIKPEFLKYDLVSNKRNLLLGCSRIDMAALIIQKSIKDFLSDSGNAYFFMPLSLLLNEGANQQFRTYKIYDVTYALRKVFDFNDLKIFKGIATRYGLVCFKRNAKTNFPIPYERHENGNWRSYRAEPLLHSTSPLSILEKNGDDPLSGFKAIAIGKESTPRQGINTCGTNHIFIFSNYKKTDASCCLVQGHIKLPCAYVYPLLTSKNFRESELTPYKWVLLPYAANGRPLEPNQIKADQHLWKYLSKQEQSLKRRKGLLIGTWLKKGYWWALLGVGPYNFMPYKIVWEAYGKIKFNPMIVPGNWQVNQSLQAYIPTRTLREAERILSALQHPAVEAYLQSLKMQGSMNWAQPGRIKKLLKFQREIPAVCINTIE